MVHGTVFGWDLVRGEESDFDGVDFLDGRDAAPLVEKVERRDGESVDDYGEDYEEVDDWTFIFSELRLVFSVEEDRWGLESTYLEQWPRSGYFLLRLFLHVQGRDVERVQHRRQPRFLCQENHISLLLDVNHDQASDLPIGPKYPINKASFQSLMTAGMNLYAIKMAGIRRKIKTRKPRPMSRATVIPVTSGRWNSLQGTIAPMYMNPPKFRSTSTLALTSSCRDSVSARYCPFQLSALPATKQANKSSVPRAPQVPMRKS